MTTKKPDFVVIDGCVQEGSTVFVKGTPYAPPSKEVAEDLVKQGVIAPIKSEAGQAVLKAAGGDLLGD
ncbi:hypothetical protein [Aquipseudomonas alcaligenes]|uniref:Uncharacterized protein n=1 Tax=Aquipseudomonas alcaligenes TaxID=43263 RepID=A0A1N6S7S7_AQUAC|nr:hypothetical protein [Pseudomonas alcaligenes]SIQ37173.1 hypothetical protein SAMN05878282_103416 [Pseudomonas alcaligenes]